MEYDLNSTMATDQCASRNTFQPTLANNNNSFNNGDCGMHVQENAK